MSLGWCACVLLSNLQIQGTAEKCPSLNKASGKKKAKTQKGRAWTLTGNVKLESGDQNPLHNEKIYIFYCFVFIFNYDNALLA